MEGSERPAPLPFRFEGQAGEYFRIWIVNVVLTLLTLGVYSAWAKVRTNKYFYRNTYLGRESFDYHAEPMQILKGRMILAVGLAVYFGASYFDPRLEGVILILIGLLIPWLVQRSLVFRLRNTSYRNLRFQFAGSTKASYLAFGKGMLMTLLTLGFGMPWAVWLRTRYAVDNARYGTAAFNWSAASGPFFGAYYGAFGIMILGFLLAGGLMVVIAPGVGLEMRPGEQLGENALLLPLLSMLIFLPAYLFTWAFIQTRLFNVTFGQAQLAGHGFTAGMKTAGMAWILFSNMVAIICSLGLLLPWAKVRMANYRLSCLQLLPDGDLDSFAAAQGAEVAAAGEEIGDYLDVDLGF